MGLFDFLKKKKNIENDNGLNENYYDNGRGSIKERFTKLNGKKHGLESFYYENGALSEKKSWKNGKEDGVGKSYNRNGQLRSETEYNKDGEVVKFYNKSGELEAVWTISISKGGIRTSNRKKYYRNGQLSYECEGLDLIEGDGFIKYYYENGQLKNETNLKDGFVDGLTICYNENGDYEKEVTHEEANPSKYRVDRLARIRKMNAAYALRPRVRSDFEKKLFNGDFF